MAALTAGIFAPAFEDGTNDPPFVRQGTRSVRLAGADHDGRRVSASVAALPGLTITVHVCTLMDMKRRTSSSHLKAKLGQYMKAVRAGEEIVVTDRDLPVARLVPYVVRDGEAAEAVPVTVPRDPGAPPLGKVDVKPIRYRGRPTTELLEADRKRR